MTSPLFVSNQQIIAPFAAGTASTLSIGSFASTFSNVSQAYAATLTVGTILNFSAGGTVGSNLILSGSINAVAGSISTLTVGSLATTFLQAATLSASTYLDVVFNHEFSIIDQTSSSGTTSSTYQMGTLAVGGGGSFAGTLAAACFTNQAAPLYTLDVAGGARDYYALGHHLILHVEPLRWVMGPTRWSWPQATELLMEASRTFQLSMQQTPYDELGYVRLRGLLVPSPTLGAVSFTLPASCRPPGPNGFRTVVCASNSPGMLFIGSDGGVGLNTGNVASGSYVFLDNICFPTS